MILLADPEYITCLHDSTTELNSQPLVWWIHLINPSIHQVMCFVEQFNGRHTVVFYLSSYSYIAQMFLSPNSDILEMPTGYRDFF